MDVEGQQVTKTATEKAEEEPRRHMARGLKLVLIVFNCLLTLIGATGGPLILRLYYLHGGSRQWLSSWLETAGFPILLLPLFLSYSQRRRQAAATSAGGKVKIFFITPALFAASSGLGLLIGLDDYLYAYSVTFLPVSTSAILVSSQLAFTAFFAFVIVRQRFTAYSINAVVLLTVGAVMLGLHVSGDRPEGVSRAQYFLGFFLTVGAAALAGLVLPLVELTYRRAKQVVRYTLVIEIQMVMSFFATAMCTVGMLVNKDFQAIRREGSKYDLGEVKYYVVLVFSAIFWQMNFLGTVGIIHCMNTLFAGVFTSALIPVMEVLGVIFFKEKFSSEKGVSLALSLWGLTSYSYGEYQAAKAVPTPIVEAA